MNLFGQKTLDQYQINDEILNLLLEHEESIDQKLTSHVWLKSDLVKRHIFNEVYSPLLRNENLRVLDVGGGYTSITKYLSKRHDYTLLDIMAHDNHDVFQELVIKNSIKWVKSDWYSFIPEQNYDIIIANDIFPNVDQRLEDFISKYLNFTKQINLSLTYYNNGRFYKVKRVDADEILFLKAVDGKNLHHILNQFIPIENPEIFNQNSKKSLFPNGRSVIHTNIKGKLK